MTKTEFLTHLRKLIGESRIEDALEWLSNHIHQFAAYYTNDIFMLNSQFNAAKNQFILQGIIENSDYNRTVSRISLAILEIANKIEKKDDIQNTRRRGHLLHKIPSKMALEKETKCIVRIAYFLEQLMDKLVIDEDTFVQDIHVAEVMTVELIDHNE